MKRFNKRARAAAWIVAAWLGIAMAAGPGVAADGSPSLVGVVNVNTASAAELQLLPGIGETRAQAILDTRKAKGGFRSVDELVDVKGIGDSALARMRPFVTLQGKTTARID